MKPSWIDGQYSSYYLNLPGQFQIAVTWASVSRNAPESEHGFEVTFNHTTLVRRFKDLDEAKRAGELLAKKKLTEALNALDEVIS